MGRFNHFRAFLPGGSADASFYWTPQTGAHEVHGAIRALWSTLGLERSYLGYPLSDEHDCDGGRCNDFQFSRIRWTIDAGPVAIPNQFVVDVPTVEFGTGLPVGGNGRLTLLSDGTTHFQGHLHDSGFPSFDCLAVFTVKDADGIAYAASKMGRLHGTDEPGSRDLDWDDVVVNDQVRQGWPRIQAGAVGGSRVDITSDWSPQKIAEDAAAAVGVVLSVIPLIAGGGSGGKGSSGAGDTSPPDATGPGDVPIGGPGGTPQVGGTGGPGGT